MELGWGVLFAFLRTAKRYSVPTAEYSTHTHVLSLRCTRTLLVLCSTLLMMQPSLERKEKVKKEKEESWHSSPPPPPWLPRAIHIPPPLGVAVPTRRQTDSLLPLKNPPSPSGCFPRTVSLCSRPVRPHPPPRRSCACTVLV